MCLQFIDAEGWQKKVELLLFLFCYVLNPDLTLFEHINILTCLGLLFVQRDVTHTVPVYLKTKSNLTFKSNMN